jgi:hypothetical protein
MSAEKKIEESCGRVCTFSWRIIDITCLFHTSLWRMLTNFHSGVSSLTRVLFECYISLILTSGLQLWTHPLRTFASLRTLLGDHIPVIFYIWMHVHVKRKLYIVSRPFLNLNELIHWCWLSFHYPVQCHKLISWMSLLLLFSVFSQLSMFMDTEKSHNFHAHMDIFNFQGLGVLLVWRHQCKKCGQSLFGISSQLLEALQEYKLAVL